MTPSRLAGWPIRRFILTFRRDAFVRLGAAIICLSFCFPLCAGARADKGDEKPEAPPAGALKNLAELKAATAFVKIQADSISGSGSGFLMKVEGDTAWVVTNEHVVNPHVEVNIPVLPPRPPGRPGPRFVIPREEKRVLEPKNLTITLVFWSGTKQEQSARAELVAADSELDLAVLKVKGIKNLPQPIDFSVPPKLVETMPLFVFGFPFGELLALKKGNPTITVGRASVSSIREDEHGQLSVVQIDGAINPGNSGGPVVDSEGRLVGIAVATIRGAHIGLAIPSPHLTRMLQGRVGPAKVASLKTDKGHGEAVIEVPLIDPLGKIKSAALHYLRVENGAPQPKPRPDGGWDLVPGSKHLELALQKLKAVATLRVPDPGKPVSFLFQSSYVTDGGKLAYSRPTTVRIDFSGPPPQIARPAPGVPGLPGDAGPKDVPALLEDLKSPDPRVRQRAAERLIVIEPDEHQEEIAKALGKLLHDSDVFVRGAASKALKSWATTDNVPELIDVLTDRDLSVRGAAFETLARLKDERGAEAVARLLPDEIFNAPPALKAMGPVAEKPVAKLLQSPTWSTRLEACKILKVIGTKRSIKVLQAAARDSNGLVRREATEALAHALVTPVPKSPPGPPRKGKPAELKAESRVLRDLSVHEVTLGGAHFLGCMCWTGDGKAVHVLEDTGLLRRIALPARSASDGLKEDTRIDLKRKCTWLANSSQGLLVTVSEAQEVWLLDSQTLQVKTKFSVPAVTRAVSSPSLAVAIALGKDESGKGNQLWVLDLEKGTAEPVPESQETGVNRAAVTPDGKFLFTAGLSGQLRRYKIAGAKVTLEESGPAIAKNSLEIQVSDQLVCLPSGGGNLNNVEDHPTVANYSTYIYKVGDLKKPALVIRQGPTPRAVAFDPKTGSIYSQNSENQLIVFDPTGAKQKEYRLASGQTVQQILVHPKGEKLLILTDAKLFLVEPVTEQKVAKPNE